MVHEDEPAIPLVLEWLDVSSRPNKIRSSVITSKPVVDGRHAEVHASPDVRAYAKTQPVSVFQLAQIAHLCNWCWRQVKIALLDTPHSGEDQTWGLT